MVIYGGDMIPYIMDKYDKWSKYIPEKKGVVLAYASMYGNTEDAVNGLAQRLAKKALKILGCMMYQRPMLPILSQIYSSTVI